MFPRRKGIMLCYPFEESRLDKWPRPWVIQPKLDGIRCVTRIEGSNLSMVTSEGNEITTAPHILETLHDTFQGQFLRLDGELWSPSLTMMQVQSILRRKEVHPDHEQIRYTVFDAIGISGADTPLYQRLAMLNSFIDSKRGQIYKIESSTVYDVKSVFGLLQAFIREGYEGFVLKNIDSHYEEKRSTNWMKCKPHQQDTYRITGYEEEVSEGGTPKGTLGALWCVSQENEPFKVGTGLTAQQRKDYWQVREALIGNWVTIKYQALTPRKVPRFPVFVEIEKGGEAA